ncbi:MAG: MFS transporter [Gammaproteobacteria bacterium]|nr:MFS transporter [Gammaproteobacteria bacterium]
MTRPALTKLSVGEKIGYGLGDTASNIFFQFVNIFLLYYYTDVFGLSPAVVGTLFIVARFWDAVNDPLMGAIADRTNTRFGKYRPYLLWMAVPFGVFGYLAFANPDFSDNGKLIYAYVTYIGLMMAYTAINVPYSALMGVMTPSSDERTSLSSYRFVGAFSGMLIISLGVRPLVRLLGDGDDGTGFKLTMALLATVAVVLFLITFATTRERLTPQSNEGQSIRRDLKFLFMNRPWIVMVIAAILTLSNVAVRGAVTNHFFKYFVGDDGTPVFLFLDKTSLILSSGAIAFIVGIFFTTTLSKRFGKRNALLGLTILNGLTLVGFYFIPADQYGTMLAVNALGNLLAGPTPALVWSIYTDVVDYGEWKFGRRTTGLAFSAAMFAQKMGLTIGGGVSGWLLALYGFIANAQQTEAALDGIRLMFSILPGALALANGLVLLFYPLTDAKVKTIEAELADRRGAAN